MSIIGRFSRRRTPISSTTNIHIMALDGVVNVNSLFTLALFLGLTFNPTNIDPSVALIGHHDFASCAAGPRIVENLVCCHVYSFSCFLFSSLVALALKQAISINVENAEEFQFGASFSLASVNAMALRVGILVSGFGSVFGCGFLMWALVDLIQIKLGTLACGSLYTLAAVAPLVLLVPMALAIFVFLVLYAFTR
ncbi:uncharacterized protein [Rutidosis leptorrhynchoides]|uniref:uncharacterized protein n=1 Tax=Rutidosis leptorrhynchoides TaxID=125765 RepID=UPI003A995135